MSVTSPHARIAVVALVLALPDGSLAQEAAPVAIDGFARPESVLIDGAGGVIYVSNINGGGGDADGNGFISRLALDGTLLDRAFIDGTAAGITLNAPKGMALTPDGVLFVTDIDRVRAFDTASGATRAEIVVPGAVFLNDLHLAGDTLHVSDSGTAEDPGRIFAIDRDGAVTLLAEGAALQRPNGLSSDADGQLLVATLGGASILALPAGTTAPATVATLHGLPAGRLDGLVALPDGTLLVSSWEAGAIFRIGTDGSTSVVQDGFSSAADIDADAEHGLLVVPLLTEDRVLILSFQP